MNTSNAKVIDLAQWCRTKVKETKTADRAGAGDRLHRIQQSMKKIDRLMAEFKQMKRNRHEND